MNLKDGLFLFTITGRYAYPSFHNKDDIGGPYVWCNLSLSHDIVFYIPMCTLHIKVYLWYGKVKNFHFPLKTVSRCEFFSYNGNVIKLWIYVSVMVPLSLSQVSGAGHCTLSNSSREIPHDTTAFFSFLIHFSSSARDKLQWTRTPVQFRRRKSPDSNRLATI